MDVWQVIRHTVLSEFTEITDVAQVIRIIIRLLLAAALGGLLGYDREIKGRAAGLRTHMLVSLGAALFVLIPQQVGASIADLTRVVQGLAAGVGFLGAGSIIMGRQQEETKGMTTAASIWLTAAIGVASGMGREVTAILSTLLALVILSLIPKFERLFEGRGRRNHPGSS
jgi:putative Mg2+ transporter-C (MgtC) family protein